eukprot:TRINITY_DN2598_c0_g1_i1.p1 TRINITY_DN2598_c0_g1~~TRINITY_DN2598_c0_g1_i1.p1  ORF type:complete len:349 (+),score=79.65 TRINITY_DN2598_c0_g1_i1:29-1075(+)
MESPDCIRSGFILKLGGGKYKREWQWRKYELSPAAVFRYYLPKSPFTYKGELQLTDSVVLDVNSKLLKSISKLKVPKNPGGENINQPGYLSLDLKDGKKIYTFCVEDSELPLWKELLRKCSTGSVSNDPPIISTVVPVSTVFTARKPSTSKSMNELTHSISKNGISEGSVDINVTTPENVDMKVEEIENSFLPRGVSFLIENNKNRPRTGAMDPPIFLGRALSTRKVKKIVHWKPCDTGLERLQDIEEIPFQSLALDFVFDLLPDDLEDPFIGNQISIEYFQFENLLDPPETKAPATPKTNSLASMPLINSTESAKNIVVDSVTSPKSSPECRRKKTQLFKKKKTKRL